MSRSALLGVLALAVVLGASAADGRSSSLPSRSSSRGSVERHVAAAGYQNASIAETALRYLGGWGGQACADAHRSGMTGSTSRYPTYPRGYRSAPPARAKIDSNNGGDGQCRSFVNCVVWMASGGTQWVGGTPDGTYFGAFLRAGGTEIKNASQLVEGDIVQIGYGVHTFIIVKPLGGATFDVVDSNEKYDEQVHEHSQTVSLSSNERAFRMGAVDVPLTPAQARGKVITVSANGSSYYYDGTLHWIPDAETYWCMLAKGHSAIQVHLQSQVDPLGNGKPWVSPCFAPNRVIGHVIRESQSGTAYLVSSDGQWHWIPDGATYQCLVAAGHTVIESNWTQINSLRGDKGQNEGPEAICASPGGSGGPVITSIADITIAHNDSGSYPVRVNYQHGTCDVAGGTWLDSNGVTHDFGGVGATDSAHPNACSGGVGYLTAGYSSCNAPDGTRGIPGRYPNTITLRDTQGRQGASYTFYLICQ